MAKHVLVAYVEDKPGVLNRVASLFRRRAFNIDSLTVGRTEQEGVSRMTIVVDTDEIGARRVEANLYKLVNVLRVDDLTSEPAVIRDLALIKIAVNAGNRTEALQLAEVFRARVVDVDDATLILEVTGSEDKITKVCDVMRPFGILSMVRTGIVAMRRGAQTTSENPPTVDATVQALVDTHEAAGISMSV
jgi:acetolactate synthase-1/3 small subunit